MGFFAKLFGGKSSPGGESSEASAEPVAESAPEPPCAVVVLRRGMNLPKPEYVAEVVAALFPQGLPESVPRVGLAQPSWYKTEEAADQIAAGVVETFAAKLELDGAHSRRRAASGPDGCPVLIVELYRE